MLINLYLNENTFGKSFLKCAQESGSSPFADLELNTVSKLKPAENATLIA